MDIGQSFQEALSTVVNFIPALLAFLAILIIGYIVAKVLAKALDKVLARAGFDRAVERSGVGQAMTRTEWDASDIISRIVFYALMLFVLQMAFGVFGPNPVAELLNGVIAFLPRLLVAIIIIVVAGAIASTVRDLIGGALGQLGYGRVLANAAGLTIVAIGAFAALNQLRIAPAIVNGLFYALLAIIAGSAIIAIGGGGIVPMRRQWDRAVSRLEEEAPRMREEAGQSGKRPASEARSQWLTVEEAAAASGLSERRVQELAAERADRSSDVVHEDGRWWLSPEALGVMIAERRDEAQKA